MFMRNVSRCDFSTVIHAYAAKRYLNLKATDVRIDNGFTFVLVVELCLKHEIALERLEKFAAKCYSSVG